MFSASLVALILVMLAELGDKTQLLVLALSTRYRTRDVVVGVIGAILALQLLATAAGGAVGRLIPRGVLAMVTGALFIGFGVWTLWPRHDEEDDGRATRKGLSPVWAVAAAFFLAELGDKTQIMTMGIAADPGAALRTLGAFGRHLEPSTGLSAILGVWIGSSLGMILADGLAIVVGVAVGKKLPKKAIKRVSGVVFIAFGLLTLGGVFLG